MEIQQIITYVVSIAIAVIAGWQTIKAKINASTLKDVGGKVDIIPVIYEAILTVEKILDGCPKGEDKFLHSQKKKKAAIELIIEECIKRNIPYEYTYISDKIEEIFIIIKGFEAKLKDGIVAKKTTKKVEK